MASFNIYRVVCQTTTAPTNFITGTTATSTSATVTTTYQDKGCEVTFQNQSTSAVNVWIGGSTLAVSIGATSTTGAGGIILAQNGTYAIGKRHSPTAIQMADFYMISTSTLAICAAHLVKAV